MWYVAQAIAPPPPPGRPRPLKDASSQQLAVSLRGALLKAISFTGSNPPPPPPPQPPGTAAATAAARRETSGGAVHQLFCYALGECTATSSIELFRCSGVDGSLW